MASRPLGNSGARLRSRNAGVRARGHSAKDRLTSRIIHFLVVWSVLLFVHEWGHAFMARRQGLDVERITVGVGPRLGEWHHGETEVVLRLLPVAGLTTFDDDAAGRGVDSASLATFSGGVLATTLLVVFLAGGVAAWERATRRRCTLGRLVIADAVVLSVFNFLPVPPLDGGRALLGMIGAWRGPLSADALFWFHVGGVALAILPMTIWTKWTAHIDAAALRWCAPDRCINAPVQNGAREEAARAV